MRHSFITARCSPVRGDEVEHVPPQHLLGARVYHPQRRPGSDSRIEGRDAPSDYLWKIASQWRARAVEAPTCGATKPRIRSFAPTYGTVQRNMPIMEASWDHANHMEQSTHGLTTLNDRRGKRVRNSAGQYLRRHGYAQTNRRPRRPDPRSVRTHPGASQRVGRQHQTEQLEHRVNRRSESLQ